MVLQILQHITDYLMSQQWAMVLAVAGSGIGVSVITQVLKRLSKAESEAVIHFLVISLSIAATALQFILSNNPQSLSIFGVYGAAVWSFSQAAYTFVVKPAQVRIDLIRSVLEAQDARRSTALAGAVTSPVPMTSLPGQSGAPDSNVNEPIAEADF